VRIYIAGPMSGLPNNNYPAFGYAFDRLVQAGLEPVSPHLLEANISVKQKEGMTRGQLYKLVLPGDIFAVASCQGIVTLPGWSLSKGANFELHAARLFEIPEFIPGLPLTASLEEWMDKAIEGIYEWRMMNTDLGQAMAKAERIRQEM